MYPGGPYRILFSFIKNREVLDWIQNECEIIIYIYTHIHDSYFHSETRAMDTSSGQKILVSKYHPPLNGTRADLVLGLGKYKVSLETFIGSAQSMMGTY